jgi:hypothetical protein
MKTPRIITISINSAVLFLGLLSMACVLKWNRWGRWRLSPLKRLDLAISFVFIIHAATSIAVSVGLEIRQALDITLLCVLFISCATSLVYMVLFMYPLSIKLKMMKTRYGNILLWTSAIAVTATKVISLALYIYIASISNGTVKNYLSLYRTFDLGSVGKIDCFVIRRVCRKISRGLAANHYRYYKHCLQNKRI